MIIEGHKVLAYAEHGHPEDQHLAVVLVDQSTPEREKYVVWVHNRQAGGFSSGHYIHDPAGKTSGPGRLRLLAWERFIKRQKLLTA